jgi:hypothetical protein
MNTSTRSTWKVYNGNKHQTKPITPKNKLPQHLRTKAKTVAVNSHQYRPKKATPPTIENYSSTKAPTRIPTPFIVRSSTYLILIFCFAQMEIYIRYRYLKI